MHQLLRMADPCSIYLTDRLVSETDPKDRYLTEIKKGFVAEIIEGKEAATITFHMAGMGGKDLTLLVSSVIQLGDRLGLFNGMEDGK